MENETMSTTKINTKLMNYAKNMSFDLGVIIGKQMGEDNNFCDDYEKLKNKLENVLKEAKDNGNIVGYSIIYCVDTGFLSIEFQHNLRGDTFYTKVKCIST